MSTGFDKTTCSAVVNGVTVEVKGMLMTGGSVHASRIRVDDHDQARRPPMR